MDTVKRHALLGGAAAVAVIVVMSLPRVGQNPAYHLMADQRTFFGVPNGLNVLSNLPFAIVGVIGLTVLFSADGRRNAGRDPWICWAYAAVFIGSILTAFGSAYYHLAPDNAGLLWDRLPMTVGFMGLLTAILGERVSRRLARIVFLPLLAIGGASVVYWYLTELAGAGDVRLYGLVEFGALLVIVLALLLYPAQEPGSRYLVLGLVMYGVAKGFEVADAQMLALGHVISGHTMKHFLAAGGVGCLVNMIRLRGEPAGTRLIEKMPHGTSHHPELTAR